MPQTPFMIYGVVAGRAILPSIFNAFDSITDDDTKFVLLAMSYKPFLSLFNMTLAAEMHPNLAGIGAHSFHTLPAHTDDDIS